jgi:hypothetical protein
MDCIKAHSLEIDFGNIWTLDFLNQYHVAQPMPAGQIGAAVAVGIGI